MPIREAKLVAGSSYHLFNRGVNRSPIFFNDGNWLFFIRQMKHYFTPDRVRILAYCLMPNHYHLLVQLLCDDFSATVMQPFSLSYVKAVNKQQARTGPLFEGPFQSRHVDRDEYLRHLTRYIHMNPVAANLVQTPELWQYSSYQEYVGLRAGTLPAKELVLGQFPSPKAYADYVQLYRTADDGRLAQWLFPE